MPSLSVIAFSAQPEGARSGKTPLESASIYMQLGPIAQSVEQRTFNPWVDGSSPSGPTHPFIRRILTDVKSLLGS